MNVSVIIPCYNCAKYVGDAIQSVFDQTYPIQEVIAVNDGSTDNTAEVLGSFGNKIVYVEQENAGPAAARNAAIHKSSSDYLAFLDADDIWLPRKLERQMEVFAAKPGVGLVYSQIVNFYENDFREESPFPRIVHSGRLFEQILVENFIPLPSVVAKADIVRSVGCFDERLLTAEDTNLWLKIARQIDIEGVSEVLVRRRKHDANLSDRMDIPVGALENLDIISSLYPDIVRKNSSVIRSAYVFRGKGLMRDLFYAGNYSKCHATGNRLLLHGNFDMGILVYWLISMLPDSLINSLRKRRG